MPTKASLNYLLHKLSCPCCAKTLDRLEPYEPEGTYEFWCDDCGLTIIITDDFVQEREEK